MAVVRLTFWLGTGDKCFFFVVRLEVIGEVVRDVRASGKGQVVRDYICCIGVV